MYLSLKHLKNENSLHWKYWCNANITKSMLWKQHKEEYSFNSMSLLLNWDIEEIFSKCLICTRCICPVIGHRLLLLHTLLSRQYLYRKQLYYQPTLYPPIRLWLPCQTKTNGNPHFTFLAETKGLSELFFDINRITCVLCNKQQLWEWYSG